MNRKADRRHASAGTGAAMPRGSRRSCTTPDRTDIEAAALAHQIARTRSGSARTPIQPTPAKAKRRSKYAASRNSPKHSPVFALNRETTLFKKDGSPRPSKRYPPPFQSSQSIKSLLPASPQAQKTNRESREQGFDKREVLRAGVRGRTLLSKSALPRLCFTHSATPRTPCRGYAPGSPEGATPRRGGRAVPSSG